MSRFSPISQLLRRNSKFASPIQLSAFSFVLQLNLTADDVETIETMGRGCEDEQENEEKEEDDSLIIDEKWDVYMKGKLHCI